jgi:hypothetical protein
VTGDGKPLSVLDNLHLAEQLRIADGICRYSLRGRLPLVEAVDLVTAVITYCRTQGIPRLLVDVRGLQGHTSLTLVDRYWMAQDWAQAAQSLVIVALVALPEQIDPDKFGVKAATDAGMTADVFTAEAAAEDWLRTKATIPADTNAR